MSTTHRAHVELLLAEAAAAHRELLSRLSGQLRASVPVDAQGLTRAIDYLAGAAGLDAAARRDLVRPHAVNPAVLHARVFGAAPLAHETVIASFVDGARVRADALAALADTVGGQRLGHAVRAVLVAHPPPSTTAAIGAGVGNAGEDAVAALRDTYAAQERAALLIAEELDRAAQRL